MEQIRQINFLHSMVISGSRRVRAALTIAVISSVALIGIVAGGVVRQAQLSRTIDASAESGRIVVQLQRETLRLITLVHSDPSTLDTKTIQLQRDLVTSRFNVAKQSVTRSYLPEDIRRKVDEYEAEWLDLQPLLDKWQSDLTDTDTAAELGNSLAALEVKMNQTEIRFSQERISQMSNNAQDAQQWLVALGITALLVIALVVFMTSSMFRITQQHQATESARAAEQESNRLKSEFLATMSHELRTPLNGVIGYADFLMTATGDTLNPKQLDYLQRILSNGERLLRLVDDILDVSRIEAGRLQLIDMPYSPAELVESLKPDLQAMTAKKGLDLNVISDPDLPSQVLGDRQRLAQIVTNLTWNAVKFTEKGHIDVSFKRTDESHWSIVVADTGIGIPAHMQEIIFEKFRQADGTLERQVGGAGLGLHIVRNIAVLMGGSIRVQSEVDRGSTFTVDLPIRTPELVKA